MQNIIRRAWQDYIINWASLTGVFFFFFFNQPVSQRWLERGDTQQGVSIWTPKQGDCGYVQEPRGTSALFLLFHFRAYWRRKVSGSMTWMLCLQAEEAEVFIPISKGEVFPHQPTVKTVIIWAKDVRLSPVSSRLFACVFVGWFVSGIAHTDFHETWMGDGSRPRMHFPLRIQIKGRIHELGLGVQAACIYGLAH